MTLICLFTLFSLNDSHLSIYAVFLVQGRQRKQTGKNHSRRQHKQTLPPSLISLMVSVEGKHHVYLLTLLSTTNISISLRLPPLPPPLFRASSLPPPIPPRPISLHICLAASNLRNRYRLQIRWELVNEAIRAARRNMYVTFNWIQVKRRAPADDSISAERKR